MRIIKLFIITCGVVFYSCSSEEQESTENGSGELVVVDDEDQTVSIPEAEEDEPLAPGTYVKISTYYGDMYITLHDATPGHRDNFLKLVREGFYDSTTFHRVIDGFMIQGGDPLSKDDDPTNDGQGGPGYTQPAEFVDTLLHVRGAVAAARLGDGANPNRESSGSQFYIVENHTGTPNLDHQYTVFGQVVKGLNVPDKICMQAKDQADRPLTNIYMTAEIVEIGEEVSEEIEEVIIDEETGTEIEE